MRTQEWYHEMSDQESEDDIDRMVGDEPQDPPPRRGVQRTPTEIKRWINHFREEFRNHAFDGNTIAHRFQQFSEECQRREENSRAPSPGQRLTNFRSEYVETMRETAMSFMRETAMSFINLRQDLQSRGARFEMVP